MKVRMTFILLVSLIAFVALIVRTAYIQLAIGDDLTDQAEALWSRSVPAKPKRGFVMDRSGNILAGNKSAPTIYVIPAQVKNTRATAQKLAVLLNQDEKDLYAHLTKRTSIERLQPEGRNISTQIAKKIAKLQLKGVYIGEDFTRDYPLGNRLSHVLGFTGSDNQGLAGLEAYYDKQLTGIDGSVQLFTDAKGVRMTDMTDDYMPPVDGMDLRLTIDARIQAIVERELDNAEKNINRTGLWLLP